jgi:hypothetical protein
VRVPAAAGPGVYHVVVSFQSGPLLGELASVSDVRVFPPLPIGR